MTQLQRVLGEFRKYTGLLPICASCRKIRDDAGRWWALEDQLLAESEAELSHGICPECAEKLYPQYFGKSREF